jgi:hypothetical protein
MFYDPSTYTGYLHDHVKNKRSNDPQIKTQPYNQKKKKPRLEEIVVNEPLLMDEQLQTEVDRIKYLLPIDSDIKADIIRVMEISLRMRQAWLVAEEPSITEILDFYPHFKEVEGLVSCILRFIPFKNF